MSWDPHTIPNYPVPTAPAVTPQKKIDQLLQEAYKTKKLCDCIIECRDGSINAHKLVLSLSSRYFEALFSSSLKEGLEGKLAVPYSIQDVKAILDFVYLGKNPFDNPPESMPDPVVIFTLSALWEIPELKQLAENVIGENATVENAEELGKLAEVYESPYLTSVYECLLLRKKPETQAAESSER